METRQPAPEYVTKQIAAQRLGLSVRRVLELSAAGLLKRHTVHDPVTKRRQTVFLVADLDWFVAEREGAGAGAELPPLQASSAPEYVSKQIAAERLGLSIWRVLELAALGLLKRYTAPDPVTKHQQTVFLAADLERFIEARGRRRLAALRMRGHG
jgi:hypothetical protein